MSATAMTIELVTLSTSCEHCERQTMTGSNRPRTRYDSGTMKRSVVWTRARRTKFAVAVSLIWLTVAGLGFLAYVQFSDPARSDGATVTLIAVFGAVVLVSISVISWAIKVRPTLDRTEMRDQTERVTFESKSFDSGWVIRDGVSFRWQDVSTRHDQDGPDER
jgi:hypothetical protein